MSDHVGNNTRAANENNTGEGATGCGGGALTVWIPL